jgi:hypothetical protein
MRGRRSGQAVPGHSLTRMLVRRLRAGARHPGTRAASGPALGVLRPLREELAADPARSPEEARTEAEKCRGRAPRGAPVRVMGRRSPGVLGDRPDREAGHGCGASAPAPVGALLPSFALFGNGGQARYRQPGYSGLARRSVREGGPAERWLFDMSTRYPSITAMGEAAHMPRAVVCWPGWSVAPAF